MENHAPELNYLCSDPDCCDNGCPRVRCTQCGRMWPCLTWQESHSAKQLAAKRRWVLRKHFPGDEDMIPYMLAHPRAVVGRCRTARMTQHAAGIHHTRQQCCYSHANVPAVTLPTGSSA